MRAFINSIFIDLMLVVFMPLVLLYSSLELRTTIKNLFVAKLCKGGRG